MFRRLTPWVRASARGSKEDRAVPKQRTRPCLHLAAAPDSNRTRLCALEALALHMQPSAEIKNARRRYPRPSCCPSAAPLILRG